MPENKEYVLLKSNKDAVAVLQAMTQMILDYGVVTFGDFLDLVGLSTTFEDTRNGWNSLDGVHVDAVKDGFRIVFPPPTNVIP